MTAVPPSLLLALLGGALAGGGLLLLVRALTPVERPAPGTSSLAATRRRLVALAGRRVPVAVVAGLVVLAVTRWPVAAVAAAGLGLLSGSLFGGAREERRQMERLEGLAAWTESLRDTIAGAVGLEQAIPATAYAASASIAAPLRTLADRLAIRTPLPQALLRFGDELDDATADLVVAALVLNARLRGPGLRVVLSSLAGSVREEIDARRRVEADRRSTRRSVLIIMLVTIAFTGGLAVFNRDYVEPYSSALGQLVLAVVVALFVAGFWWMRRLSSHVVPARLLTGAAADGLGRPAVRGAGS
ncbi:type II secretion system protein [Pseudokineococcus marinus]|uniref:Type II secretion system protein n=1 Tax=Pseudokineococcus marinus TaxID=351215 RepID=A0A849BSX2_9ACTN|nr:type II secretion system protein [Pseudokineococcus marinus]NNH24543.1 type II secretion system protein [Pseudokineococcus marinus]